MSLSKSNGFAVEADMEASVRQWLEAQGFTVMRQRRLWNRLADLVAVEFDDARCQQRLRQGPLSPWGASWRCAREIVQPPDWYPLHRRVWAIELKLTDYQTAVYQCRAYGKAALETYVAMPEEELTERRLPRVCELCEKHGVGLLCVRPDGVTGFLHSEWGARKFRAEDVVNTVEKAWKAWRKEHRDVARQE